MFSAHKSIAGANGRRLVTCGGKVYPLEERDRTTVAWAPGPGAREATRPCDRAQRHFRTQLSRGCGVAPCVA